MRERERRRIKRLLAGRGRNGGEGNQPCGHCCCCCCCYTQGSTLTSNCTTVRASVVCVCVQSGGGSGFVVVVVVSVASFAAQQYLAGSQSQSILECCAGRGIPNVRSLIRTKELKNIYTRSPRERERDKSGGVTPC